MLGHACTQVPTPSPSVTFCKTLPHIAHFRFTLLYLIPRSNSLVVLFRSSGPSPQLDLKHCLRQFPAEPSSTRCGRSLVAPVASKPFARPKPRHFCEHENISLFQSSRIPQLRSPNTCLLTSSTRSFPTPSLNDSMDMWLATASTST